MFSFKTAGVVPEWIVWETVPTFFSVALMNSGYSANGPDGKRSYQDFMISAKHWSPEGMTAP